MITNPLRVAWWWLSKPDCEWPLDLEQRLEGEFTVISLEVLDSIMKISKNLVRSSFPG